MMLIVSCRYLLLLPTAEHTTLAQTWLTRHIPEYTSIEIRNIQSAYVSLGLLGPMSSQLLQTLTQTPLNESQYPVDSCKVNRIKVFLLKRIRPR